MTKLTPCPDTITNPEAFALSLATDGSDNYRILASPDGGDEVDLLGDGVPGPAAPEIEGNDDDIAQELENGPLSMRPHP